MSASTKSILSAGTIGGLTLALAIAAQRFAKDYDAQFIGMLIIIVGFSLIGVYAAKNGGATSGRKGAQAGLFSGFIAGLLVALAYVAANLLVSLSPEQMEAMKQLYPQSVESLRTFSPALAEQTLTQWQAMSAPEQNAMLQMSFGLASCCSGVFYPLMGMVLGAMGGGMTPRTFGDGDNDASNKTHPDKTKPKP